MKPDWKDAPEWAQWLAMDKNGQWYWYELKPLRAITEWVPQSDSLMVRAVCGDDWKETLQERPE